MGIAGFQKWLVSNFPSAVTTVPMRASDSYAHVAFDMNQLCHMAARRAHDSQTVAKLLFTEIDATLRVCVPTRSIFFAFDGPAPFAKLLTQRRRRAKEASRPPKLVPRARRQGGGGAGDDLEHGKSRRGRRGAAVAPQAASAVAVDRVALTPGTQLMHDLFTALEYYAYKRLQMNPRFQHLQIRISGPNVPGEGELKIFDWLNSFVVPRAPTLPAPDSVVVVGSDADIVLQALATVAVQNIFVYIQSAAPGGAGRRTSTVISVWNIACHLHKLFPQDSLTVRLDFIAVAIMNGNDYVPKLRGSTMARLWRRYLKLRGRYGFDEENAGEFSSVEDARFAKQTLIDPVARTFNWPFLCALVKNTGAAVPDITVESLTESRQQPAQSQARSMQDPSTVIPALGLETRCESSDSDMPEDAILYDGNEDGASLVDIEDDNEGIAEDFSEIDSDELASAESEESEQGDSESEFDEYEDPDSAHIATLIEIAGSSGKFYDTEHWLRTLLYTLHMYIDGYCPDYEYSYTKPYAPSSKVLASYIEAHDGDPHPTVQGPVSATPPLTPLKAAFAMLPKHAAHHLPKPLEALVHDTTLYSKIFISDFSISIEALHCAVDRIPEEAYTPEERARGAFGRLTLLRLPNSHDRVPISNPVVASPGSRFPAVESVPVIMRLRLDSTSVPPCFCWPTGSIPNMLGRRYKWAHASRGGCRARLGGSGTDSKGREVSTTATGASSNNASSSGTGRLPAQSNVRGSAKGDARGSKRPLQGNTLRTAGRKSIPSSTTRPRSAGLDSDSKPAAGNREQAR